MISGQQVASSREHGYLGVEQVYSAAEVAELRRVTDEFVERSRPITKNDDVFDLEPSHTRESPRVRRLKNTAKHHPAYRRTLEHPRMLDIVAQLIGPSIYKSSFLPIINTMKQSNSLAGGGPRLAHVIASASLLLLTSMPVFGAGPKGPYDLGHEPHLFLDDYLIERHENIRRKVRQPEPHAANPVLTRQYPWEALRAHAYGGVMFDQEKNRFRLWYLAYGPLWSDPEHVKLQLSVGKLAYAESMDGIRWVKPFFDMFPLLGYPQTNVIQMPPGGSNVIAVFRDDHERDPKKRYKAMWEERPAFVQRVAFSEDGIRWNPPEGIKVMEGKKDSGIAVFWSEKLQKYMAFVRSFEPGPTKPGPLGVFRTRSHSLVESKDFLNWTEPKVVFLTDELDGASATQVYGMAVTPYGDGFVGLVSILRIEHMNPHPFATEKSLEHGRLDVQLAFSRDGEKWTRLENREPFMPTGRPGQWDDEERRTLQNILVHNDKVYIYYTGSSNAHATKSPSEIGLATLPADRFAAVEAVFRKTYMPDKPPTPGVIVTKMVKAPAGKLVVNAELADLSSLTVEILDAHGNAVPGFEAKHCRLRRYDDLRYEVRFESSDGTSRTVKDLQQRDSGFRLRIKVFEDAALFAFQIKPL